MDEQVQPPAPPRHRASETHCQVSENGCLIQLRKYPQWSKEVEVLYLDLYQNRESFNGWIIMTIFLSLVGISIMLDINRREDQKAKEVFLQINLLDKGNFQMIVIFTLLFGILTAILFTKIEGFSFWQFLTGLLFFSGLVGLARSIKVNRV